MYGSVVAKMYVSAIQSSSNLGDENINNWAHLNAVYSPDKSTENYSFSSATPNATAKVNYRTSPSDTTSLGYDWAFTPGRFYRLYFEKAEGEPEDSDQLVLKCEVNPGSSGSDCPSNQVSLGSRNKAGSTPYVKVEMTINNPHALAYFEQGGLYRVRFEETTKDGN